MEKKKTNRVRMYLMLSGLSILLTGCTQINENEENVSQLETEENISLEQERLFHDEPHSYRYTREGELLYEMVIEEDEMQKSFRAEEYLEQEIQELDDYEYYINKKSEGQAFLIVESDPDLMELYGEDKKLLGYYYLIYVGEQWEDHRVNWDWFYVREDLEEILWCEIVDGTLYSMEDWRESLQYKRRKDMIIDLRNQEKERASLSLSEENDLTPERFFFQPDENVICVYEGTIEFDSINNKYALYKETAEKDIVFVNMLFVEKETGMIFTWEGENLVSVSIQEAEKLNLPGNSELETEHDWSYENIPEEELLSKVMETLKETGHSEKNVIYDGTIDFINRRYYMVSGFENFEDHILRGQTYYIDRKNGYLYRVEEEPDSLRTELYYIGDLKTETIQPDSEENEETAEFTEIRKFFQEDYMDLKANAEYVDDGKFEKSTVFAEWYLVKNYEYGSVYRLKVEPVGNLKPDRLNTYFYITNDKIYRLWGFVYGENEVIDFCDNDELLTEILDTDEKLKNNGVVVCQDEEIEDELEEYEEGQHTSLHKWKNKISYNSYYKKANGDLNYYETFVWEEGKGLVEFRSGFRVERDILYLTDITKTIVEG